MKARNDCMVVKAGRKFDAKYLYKSHLYFLNGDWINKEMFDSLSKRVKNEAWRRWTSETTFTAPQSIWQGKKYQQAHLELL